MIKYRYTAKEADGNKVRGLMEAQDKNELYTRLREQDLYLVSFSKADRFKRIRKLKTKELSEFCRELGTLLRAGVSLVRALAIVSQEESFSPYARSVYSEVLRLTRQGNALSDAMEQQEEVFPQLLISMFRAAEASGTMDRTSLRMAEHFEKDHRLNGKVKSAMIYPEILGGMLIVVVAIIVSFVIPQFKELFDQLDELPLPTTIVLGLSDFVVAYWFPLIVVIACLIVGYFIVSRFPKVRIWKDQMKIRMPLFGKLLKVIYTARFARTLCSLYTSGLPIVLALEIGKTTVGNYYIESQFDEAIANVRRGELLSDSLGNIDGFVQKLAASVLIGEETGSLDTMLESIADNLEFEAELAINRMVTLMEPIILIIMAIIVGFVMMAVMLPIYESYSAIEGMG